MKMCGPPARPGPGWKRCTGDWNECYGWAYDRGDGYSDVLWNDSSTAVIETKRLIISGPK